MIQNGYAATYATNHTPAEFITANIVHTVRVLALMDPQHRTTLVNGYLMCMQYARNVFLIFFSPSSSEVPSF